MNDKGLAEFARVLAQVRGAGYCKPWWLGVEGMTKDHVGYIYWRGVRVEHYSFRSLDEEKAFLIALAERCKKLEAMGIEVNMRTAVWSWDSILQKVHGRTELRIDNGE